MGRPFCPEIKGDSGQEIINGNAKNMNNYDIYVGIMWKYFGTPTNNYMSGTEEEFELAMKKQKDFSNGTTENGINIMFYFSNIPHRMDDVNPD